MRFLCAEIQNIPIKVRNARDSSVNLSNVQNVKKFDQTQREILIINIDISKHTHTQTHTHIHTYTQTHKHTHTHTQLRGAYFYLRSYKSIRR